MTFVNWLFGILAVVSFVLLLWQWLAAQRFPLHQLVEKKDFTPAISILKPLKGCDDTTADSLRSWFKQNYAGQIQILFAVTDADDPAIEIVRQLLAENPNCDAQLVVCEKLDGANAKVAKLARLEKLAKHDLILTSDADVRVPQDLLANIVSPLRDDKAALVSCFYRLANPVTPAMQWEAVAINADFWSQVLQSQSLGPLNFALGATILVRRKALDEIGGFKSLADCLADDYQLGNRIAKNGHHLGLCPVVVECWAPPMDWRVVWKHQLRWARTIRACQPLPYFFSILSNASLWPLLWLVAEFFHWWLPVLTTGAQTNTFRYSQEIKLFLLLDATFVLALLLIRITLAHNLQRRLTPDRQLVSPIWLVPVKDLFQAALWLSAFLGDTVEWRGRKIRLRRDGTLVEI